MNTMSNTSTTTPMTTPNQAPEIRVRPVGLPEDCVVILGGTLGPSAGCGVGVSEAGDPSFMKSLLPFGLGPPSLGASISLKSETPGNPVADVGGTRLAVVKSEVGNVDLVLDRRMESHLGDEGSPYGCPTSTTSPTMEMVLPPHCVGTGYLSSRPVTRL
jgi:hypothetical protein